MTMTDQKLKTLVLGPQDHRLREPLDVLGEQGLVKLAGPPVHRHSREDEWFYVLDGELTWEVDGQGARALRRSLRAARRTLTRTSGTKQRTSWSC
jgi:mannose-6-phosphate isomerase-like protein (cupin superfamily)